MSISIDRVSKKFGSFTALERVSLDVPDGELLALLGPSGSGKTTLLRIIAGLEVADSGTVISDGEDITNESARHRKVGFVFQHYALFRHMTVAQNIAYGLKVRKAPKKQIRERVDEMLQLIRLETLQNRYPAQLSGGQRQRVALARALAAQPSVLLLDEPFGALDAKVRQELRQWIRRLHDEIHVTSIFVTHDQEEAFEVADRGGRDESRAHRADRNPAGGLQPSCDGIRVPVPRQRHDAARHRSRRVVPARRHVRVPARTRRGAQRCGDRVRPPSRRQGSFDPERGCADRCAHHARQTRRRRSCAS
jgi:sulfate ABC transporter ATP-binding protein